MEPLSEQQVLDFKSRKALQTFEFDVARISQYEHHLITIHYIGNCDVDVPLVKKVHDTILQMTQGEKYRVVVLADAGVNFTKEGREFSVQQDQTSNKVAWAAVTNNLGHIIMVNFFLKINKPNIPFRLFKNIEDAVAWVEKY